MRYRQQRKSVVDRSITDPDSVGENQCLSDSNFLNYHDPTVDCYKRRDRILADAHRAEWWMVVAVLLMIAAMGFVAFQ